MFFRVLLVVFGLFRPGAARAPLITIKYKRKYIGNPPKVSSRLPLKRYSKLAVSQILRAAKAL